MVTTSYDEGDSNKDTSNSDKELVTASATFTRGKKLKECTMMKNYKTMGTFTRGKKLKGDPTGKAATPFREEKVVMSIYGGPARHESQRKLKLTDRAINVVSVVVPEYLHCSESSITFDRTDHLNSIPKPGRFPIIVDPLVGMTQLTKDGGSGLILMYIDTFEGLGLTCD
jgi:hypothetical protein